MAWHVIEPGTPFTPNWHIDAVCDHLAACSRGEIIRLLINMPPGMLKSLLVSVFWPSWEWGPLNMPWLRMLSTSYEESLTKRDTRRTRDLISSEWYQTLWGHRFHLTRSGEGSYANNHHGSREARAFKSLTGGRADRLGVDDPHSTETAESPAERERALRIFRESVPNRINDPRKSVIIIIMQRLGASDVSAEALKADGPEKYVHLCMPMRYEEDRACKTYVMGKLFFSDPRTKPGELLFPERMPQDMLDAKERLMGSFAVAAQHQQRPGPREGNMFKRHWFEIVDASPAIGTTVRAWDLAGTKVDARKKNDPDWTVGIRMKRTRDGIFYIESEVRLREEALAVERAVKQTSEMDGSAVRVRVPQDPGSAGKGTAAAFVKLLAGKDIRVRPETGDKATRATPMQAQAEAGNIKLVKGLWNEAFLDELCGFPDPSMHDDRVDAASSAFDELVRFGESGGHAMPMQAR